MKRKTHKLKILRDHFIDVVAGEKRAELRKNDRDFKIGDFIVLQEFDNGATTGDEHKVVITHILAGGSYGLDKDYCILSIKSW